MFHNCSGFGIHGGVFNNVQGNQHNVTYSTTNKVRGASNTYRTVNRGNYNVTNNGVNSDWDEPRHPYPDQRFQQGPSPYPRNGPSSSYGPNYPYNPKQNVQQPQPQRPGMHPHISEPTAYDDSFYEQPQSCLQQQDHPTPPASAPPTTGRFDGVQYGQSRSSGARTAPAPVQQGGSPPSSAQHTQLPMQARRSPVQSSSERTRAFPVPGESRGAPRAQAPHPSPHPAPAQAETPSQGVDMAEEDEDESEDDGASGATIRR